MYSEPGKGSTFKVYLPAIDARPETRIRDVTSAVGGSETVLLVEDDDFVRETSQTMLRHLGYKVLCARNGNEALAAAREGASGIDLIFTDVVMPGMNGKELVEKIQPIHPNAKALFASGYTENIIIHHAVSEPFAAFIEKPFSIYSSAAKIREVLSRKN